VTTQRCGTTTLSPGELPANVAAGMAAMGLPEEDIKKFLDPKNHVEYNITETSPGCYEVNSHVSLMPEWNQTYDLKLGEKKELTAPIPCSVILTKKSDNVYLNRSEMMGKTLITEQTYSNYGMDTVVTVEGTGVSFTEIFKRVTPKISGYYTFESETGLAGLMAAMGFDDIDTMNVTKDSAFRMKDMGDKFETIEYFGGEAKLEKQKYNEEYDYERAEWKINDKRITTKVGPGMVKTVCKDKKTGKTWDYTLCFTEKGCKIQSKYGNTECQEVYKRGADVEGTWKPVSNTGACAFADALGMTGAVRDQWMEGHMKDWFKLERLQGGLVRMNTSSKIFGETPMIYKSGEEWSIDVPGFGKMTGITHEGCDSSMQAVKTMGKTLSYTDKISGDFLISVGY